MNSRTLYLFLAVLIVLNFYLLYRLRTQQTNQTLQAQTESNRKPITDSSGDLRQYASSLRGRILIQAKYGTGSIDPNAKVMDTAGKEVPLSSVITGKENLVFFFTYKHCYSCIDGTIPLLENLANKIGYDKIFVLGDLYERRDILTFKQKYNSKLRIYSIADNMIHAEAKELSFPFMFLLDKQLKIRSLFFAEKDLPEVTSDYLNDIDTYFKK
jgi:hypothetical protein